MGNFLADSQIKIYRQRYKQADARGDTAAMQKIAAEVAQHAMSLQKPGTSGNYANQWVKFAHELGATDIPLVDPNRKQQNGPIADVLKLGGIAAAGIAGGALLGVGPAAAGAGAGASGAGAAGTAATVAGAAQKAGGVLGAIKEYGPLVLGGLGAVNAANQQGRADDLQRQALQYAQQDYQNRAPLREMALAKLTGPQAQRPDLAPIFSQSSNPYTQARYGKVR